MAHISEWPTFSATRHLLRSTIISSTINDAFYFKRSPDNLGPASSSKRQESKKIYGVARKTLGRRRAGKPARRDITPNSKKLTQSEEEAIVRYVLDLDTRAFPPRERDVEDMAN